MPTFTQKVAPGLPADVPVQRLKADSCLALLDRLGLSSHTDIDNDNPIPVAVSFRLTKGGFIEAIALAADTTVFQVTVTKNVSHSDLASVLSHPRCLFVAVDMARVALLLHRQFGMHIRGVDLATLPCPSIPGSKKQHPAVRLAHALLPKPIHGQGVCALFYRSTNKDLCLRAWLSAWCVSVESSGHRQQKPPGRDHAGAQSRPRNLSGPELACLSQLVLNVELLDAERPTRMDNDFERVEVDKTGSTIVTNARFKSKVRESGQTVVHINGGKVKALATGAKGKETTLRLLGKGKLPEKVTKGLEAMDESPFVKMLWFPPSKDKGRHRKRGKTNANVAEDVQITTTLFQKLNPSQQAVVRAVVGDKEPLVIAHGPPGTGKTSTIAVALDHWGKHRKPAWVIAHSNVGVKNIAESLVKRKIDFKIVVSQDFYYEWHEHHYVDISDHLIQSDKLLHKSTDINVLFGKTKIILCTLSMLSSPAMDMCGVFQRVPVERLVVDEASQIDTFEFMVCMFGDPNQLPPYGKETAPKMKTIFDFAQFRASSYFLDTQYRMPVPLGDFISKHVYDSRLKSSHAITAPNCVKFVDVRKGAEAPAGSSWKNMDEVHTVVNLVKRYYKDERKVCIITPYDGQRAALVSALKTAGLPHGNVYNVDSYQGHEAPLVIVSVVRTSAPGFLKSLNRMNVMLTRCQAGMVIVTNRAFLCGPAQKTLLGKLADHWGSLAAGARPAGDSPESAAWVDAMRVAEGTARLPGSG
ncbi:hypothetical protein GSI_05094 [Ganoderma sinense ZZ0214-1]|uniref:DNA2/NAM7 helicase-like C-terminal domain-containing protein n=1 Tax=Ganoderma sinense ZZ0214-1 TaxID=1077348 RepID=A0A2G8SGU0_9APHY|nr:hypothetical protein GSI_05094 [Ganoderma sinense ZZ0214-1]